MTEQLVSLNGETAYGTRRGVLTTTEEFDEWWAGRHRAGRFEVTRIPFAELGSWRFDGVTGNLGHESGRFFTVEGVQVEVGGQPQWSQPIINQPEIGVLGIVVQELDGVLHCLMQAKMEPGNVNTLQLSPTVQATRSNYMQVHRGSQTRYLEYFAGPRRGEVLVDVLQSEQGAWFWRKRNRNIVVKITGEVPLTDDYRWLPLPLVYELMRRENLVNMDARTVLSCVPLAEASEDTAFAELLGRSYGHDASASRSIGEVLSWFIEAKTACDYSPRLVPLTRVEGWSRTAEEIVDDERRRFRIIGVSVAAGNREVTRWTQPLLEPRGQGTAVFVTRPINGVLHLLVQARPEIGLLDMVEMGPTVQLSPGEDITEVRNPLLRDAATGALGQVRYDTVLSEEGGRFHRALTRYRVVEVGEDFPVDVGPDYCWMTMRQLMELLRHGHYLNIEARSLLACVHSLW